MTKHAFPKSLRLLHSGDFQLVFANPPFRASHQHLLMLARPNDLPRARLGLVIAKKHVRHAVQRNRMKRLIRESFRHRQQSLRGLDVIVLARKGMDSLDNRQLRAQLEPQWQRVVRKYAQSLSSPAADNTPG